MFSQLDITKFRGIAEGRIAGLTNVSVIVGPNNSGKSSCLEAIEIACSAPTIADILSLAQRRGGRPHAAARHLIYGDAKETSIVLSGETTRSMKFSERATYIDGELTMALEEGLVQPIGLYRATLTVTRASQHVSTAGLVGAMDASGKHAVPTIETGRKAPHPSALVDVNLVRGPRAMETAYSEIDRTGRLDAVVTALRASMSSLTDLRILESEGDFVLHAFLEGGARVPAYLFGDGFKRLLELAAALAQQSGAIVLLEEPECFQHPRYQIEFVRLLQHAAARGVQIVLSTHSLELLDRILHAEWPDDAPHPSVHRLRLVGGQLACTSLNRREAVAARDEIAEDLRT